MHLKKKFSYINVHNKMVIRDFGGLISNPFVVITSDSYIKNLEKYKDIEFKTLCFYKLFKVELSARVFNYSILWH